ncbi:MAG: calcium/sodium antiporter [Gammaproteobacteria bacterium]|nr:MAG: calcium/sodium antiporter [Gammaproteobacteria bacterium]
MSAMFQYSGAIAIGFILLIWAAERFVVGSSGIARNLGVPPLIIGLTIVGFGTSAPEIFVSAIASWQGSPTLGIGNAIGSNITNVGLILGLTALITPLTVQSETLKREFPILLVIMLVVWLLIQDKDLSRVDGLILFTGLLGMLYWMVRLAKRSRVSDPMQAEYAAEMPEALPMPGAILWFVIGLVGLMVSSRILVWGAVNIAQSLGVSDLVIGLTIVAIGTSLPELAASIVSALKNEHDIAIGNVLGSNMYNLLAVMSLPGLIAPSTLPASLLSRDYSVMLLFTIILFVMAYGFKGSGRLNRIEGLGLLCLFLAYEYWIFLSAM